MSKKCELILWEDVRKDCKYPVEDNNNGYVYGLNLLLEDETIDVSWFKTDNERFKEIRKKSWEVF